MSESVDSESRFAHLLKPIKDLAQSWSVDVATELSAYLQELDDIHFTYENYDQLNFAQGTRIVIRDCVSVAWRHFSNGSHRVRRVQRHCSFKARRVYTHAKLSIYILLSSRRSTKFQPNDGEWLQ